MSSVRSQEDMGRGYIDSIEMADLGCEPTYADLELHSESESMSEEFQEWFHSARRNRGSLPPSPRSPKIKIELDRMTYKLQLGKATKDLITNVGDLIKTECNAEFHDLNPIRVEWKEGNPPTVTMDLENYEGPLPGENPLRTYSPLSDDYRIIKGRFFLATGLYLLVVGFGLASIYMAFKKGLL